MVGSGASRTDLGAWADTYHLTFPVMFDDYSLFTIWETPGTPAQHLIGKGSEILDINTHITDDVLEDALGM